MSVPSSSVELSVIIPAYKEADSLRLLLPRLMEQLDKLDTSYEILIIDSRVPVDDTQLVCAANQVRHIRRSGGDMYGDAVRSGIRAAGGRHILFMDADGSHNPAQIRSLWASRTVADIVIGSRYVKGGETENPWILIFLSYVVNVTFRVAFGISCRDVTNSFRLYSAKYLQSIELECDNFDVIQEILIKLLNQNVGLRVLEVPITFERRKAGESKRNLIAFTLTYISTLMRLRSLKSKTKREGAKRRAA